MDLGGDAHKPSYHSRTLGSVQSSRHGNSVGGGGAKTALFMGCLPIVANLFSSSLRTWSEFFMLFLVMIWVTYVLEAPWKAFYNCRRARYSKRDRLLIVMMFVSPWVAAYSLYAAKNYFGDLKPGNGNGPLREFSIPLFLFAALIRPVAWLLRDGQDLAYGSKDKEATSEIRQYRHLLGQVLDRLDRLEGAFPSKADELAEVNDDAEGAGSQAAIGSNDLKSLEALLVKKVTTMNREYERRILELEFQVLSLSREKRESLNDEGLLATAMRLAKISLLRVVFIIFFPWFFARSVVRRTFGYLLIAT